MVAWEKIRKKGGESTGGNRKGTCNRGLVYDEQDAHLAHSQQQFQSSHDLSLPGSNLIRTYWRL